MPVNGSMKIHSARQFPKPRNEEKTDLKRARGQISCAECRRLKLKCDKNVPCGSCVRRGCSGICPNGTRSAGQRYRSVPSDTTKLYQKLVEMGQRIRQLEDAIAILQATISSTEEHPLLRDELLSIKNFPEMGSQVDRPHEDPSLAVSDLTDVLGTLTIGHDGEAIYFGRSAGSESLFLAGSEMEINPAEDDLSSPLSPEISRLSNSFPLSPSGSWDIEQSLDTLYHFLPPQARAWSLCESYAEQGSWVSRPIKREDLIDDILSPIYKALKERNAGNLTAFYVSSAHKLAVLYMIFALGALVDLTLPRYNAEAENYLQLSRASLSLRSIFDSPEMATVAALTLMASFHCHGGPSYALNTTWSIISLAAKLAQSIGLHRDGARWNLDAKIVEKRRVLFWDVFSLDAYYSLSLGRPPSIGLSYVDCEFPTDDEASLGNHGEPQPGYDRWKWEFMKDILSAVTELTLTAQVPNYQTILDLDRKVREKPIPPKFNVFLSPVDTHFSPSAYMRGCLLSQCRAVTLMYIHRNFFAQAMLDYPVNPLRSPYAPSFLAAYRCASAVITLNTNYFSRFPDLCMRWWSLWSSLFSAAIIVGSIVTRVPSSSMAPTAFVELGLAVNLFEQGAVHSRRARSGLVILRRLKAKALSVQPQFHRGQACMPLPTSDLTSDEIHDPNFGEDELAIFGGHTRVLFSKLLSKQTLNPKPSRLRDQAPPDVHPSLVEYLSLFTPSPFPDAFRETQIHDPPRTLSQNSRSDTGYSLRSPSLGADRINECGRQSSSLGEPSVFSSSFSSPPLSGSDSDHIQSSDFNSFSDAHFVGSSANSDGDLMSREFGMDMQWMSFMQDFGILDSQYKV